MHLKRTLSAAGICALALAVALLGARPERASATGGTVISAGFDHTCLAASGSVSCWGANASGRLGDGTTTDRSAPVPVVGLSAGVASVAAGLDHTCALMMAGSVKCWGQGGSGQLGDGTQTTSAITVDVVGLADARSIAAGLDSSCAVTTAGGVRCWGLNWFGELGDGTTTLRDAPVEVLDGNGNPLTGITAVAAGWWHTCAITEATTLTCWGLNSSNQLGNQSTEMCGNSPSPCSTAPVDVLDEGGSPLTGVVAVEAGYQYTCAVMAIGDVMCWGVNAWGNLGDGTAVARARPVNVVGLEGDAVAVSTFGRTTCAVTSAGAIKCWGWNGAGQLGNGTADGDPHPVPAVVEGLGSGMAAVSPGEEHTCALTVAGNLKCWGDNNYGQVGIGVVTLGDIMTPADVLFASDPDDDDDGCTDAQELGASATEGGLRNPKSFWDFFDVWTGAPPTRDKSINIADVGAVVARFGSVRGSPPTEAEALAEALTPPVDITSYHAGFDRSGSDPAGDVWDLLPPNGVIDISDIGAVVAQFGHSCA